MAEKAWKKYSNKKRGYARNTDYLFRDYEYAAVEMLAKNHFCKAKSYTVRAIMGLEYINNANQHLKEIVKILNFKT